MPLTRKNPRDPDSPFLTREAIGKGASFRSRFPNVDPQKIEVVRVADEARASSRPRVSERTKKRTKLSVPLASDLVTQLRATGPEWPELADKILRAGLKRRKQKAA
jgi:uncharacterized protein (DUF4415 family)